MSELRFSDGITIDTGGELRPLVLHDGWYVVGKGMLIPVASQQDARATIQAMSKPTDACRCGHSRRDHHAENGRIDSGCYHWSGKTYCDCNIYQKETLK